MTTATVQQSTATCKVPLSRYAHLYDQEGILTKIDGRFYFRAETTGDITVLDFDHFTFLFVRDDIQVHGERGEAETQAFIDTLNGGLAAIACTRAN